MPPLEAIPTSDLSDLNHSGPSGTFSTASTQEELQHRLKDMGGRAANHPPTPVEVSVTPTVIHPTTSGNVTHEVSPITCSFDNLRVSRTDKNTPDLAPHRHTTPGKDDARSYHSHRTRSASHLSTALASSNSDSGSRDSSSRCHSRHMKRRKRKRRPTSSSPQESCDSLLPQGLVHARYRRPRPVVRHMSLKPKRRGSGDRVDAIVDRLGAMTETRRKRPGVCPNWTNLPSARFVASAVLRWRYVRVSSARNWRG